MDLISHQQKTRTEMQLPRKDLLKTLVSKGSYGSPWHTWAMKKVLENINPAETLQMDNTQTWFRWCDLELCELRMLRWDVLLREFFAEMNWLDNVGMEWMFCMWNEYKFWRNRVWTTLNCTSLNSCPVTQSVVVCYANLLIEGHRKGLQKDCLSLWIFMVSHTIHTFWILLFTIPHLSQIGNIPLNKNNRT